MKILTRIVVAAVSAIFSFSLFAERELDSALLIGTTDKDPFSYKVGEEIVFSLDLKFAKPFADGAYVLDWTRNYAYGKSENFKSPLVYGQPFVIKTRLDAPGFFLIKAFIRDAKGNRYRRHEFDDGLTLEGGKPMNEWEKKGSQVVFVGSAAAEPEKMRTVPEPADFDAFWAERKRRLAAVPMQATVKEHPSKDKDSRVFTFSVACAGPRPVTGTLTVPSKPGKYPAQISFHGYSKDFIQTPPASGYGDRLHMFINAHGYELGREKAYYEKFYESIKSNGIHYGCDPVQNRDPDNAYFLGMAYRIMRALEYLKSRPEWDGKHLTAIGGSMGGLQSIWAGALDSDVTKLDIYVPWCCDMAGRDTFHRLRFGGPEESPGLRYLDPVKMAKMIPEKTWVDIWRAGLGDESSPPDGIWLFYNALKCRKSIRWVQGSSHGSMPPDPFVEDYRFMSPDPKEVGHRLTRALIDTTPPRGLDAYWVHAMEYASIVDDENLSGLLQSRFRSDKPGTTVQFEVALLGYNRHFSKGGMDAVAKASNEPQDAASFLGAARLREQAYRTTRGREYLTNLVAIATGYLARAKADDAESALALATVLKYLDAEDPGYAALLKRFQGAMAALKAACATEALGVRASLCFAQAALTGIKCGALKSGDYLGSAHAVYLPIAQKFLADKKPLPVEDGAELLGLCNALLEFGTRVSPREFPPKDYKLDPWAKVNPPPIMRERMKRVKPVGIGKLRLTPTFCSCSVVWGVSAKEAIDGLGLEYRKVGAKDWTKGEDPIYFPDAENYRISIFYLDEDTDYEMRLVKDGLVRTAGTFRTWKSDVPVARTIVLDPATAKYPIVVKDKGRPDGWIRYTMPKGAVLGGKDVMTSVIKVLKDAEYVLFDDLTVEGGGGDHVNPIFIEGARAIRVRNCEFYGYGIKGTPYLQQPFGGKFARPDGTPYVDWSAGVMIYPGSSEIVVERCYFHDPRGRSNSWYYSHPSGMQGIFVFRAAHSVVLRWNDIVGSDLHRWNDAIEGCDNFGPGGGFNRDADIYGNFCIFANDDCIELDGGEQNVRCFRNRFESAITAVSVQGCQVSPVFVFDNLLGPDCEEFGYANPTIKTSAFDTYWYMPYGGIWGNYLADTPFKVWVGPLGRWDYRDSNVMSTNVLPKAVATKYPVRDLPFVLDEGRLEGITVAGNTATPKAVTFKAIATADQPFTIRKNFDSDWFDVTPAAGILKKGETTFTVTFKPEKMVNRRYWRAAFLVRTPEGLSRCCSLYAERTDFAPPLRPVPEGAKTLYRAVAEKTPYEVTFDVREDGEYWLFARAQGAEHGFPVTDISVDGAKPKPMMLRVWPTHEVWTMCTPGKRGKFNGAGLCDPLKLTKGKHTFKVILRPNNPVRIAGFALSDQPFAFEPR